MTIAAWALARAGALCSVAHAQIPAETVLHDFSYPLQGTNPQWSLAEDSVGNLYGTTEYEGPGGAGTVFKLAVDGKLTVLHSFSPGRADGSGPSSGVTFDQAGNLYGTTQYGGSANLGAVYKINASGVESLFYSFEGGSDGANPHGNLTVDSAGNIYGVTLSGGSGSEGTVYKLNSAGAETVLHSFDQTDGLEPNGSLLLDGGGNLIGTTQAGGTKHSGLIYRLTQAGQETVLYAFSGHVNNGNYPNSGVTQDGAGNLYGTVASGGGGQFGFVYKLDSQNQLTVLYKFQGGNDGGEPDAGVILDAAGNLYGTAGCCGLNSGGVIYKLTPAGDESVLLNFGVAGRKGTGPTGLIFGANGNLYGVTTDGGAGGEGIVYSLNRAGQETVLYSFPDSPGGYDLTTSLASDPSGNLYGVNLFGGLPGFGQGVVYRISPTGQETVLYAFEPDPDGFFASSGVVFDAAGNLYGETSLGGEYGAGTVYKISSQGAETILFSFGAQLSATGQNPEGGLALDADGNLYGTAIGGGGDGGLVAGIVFRLDPSGKETILHQFGLQAGDGAGPAGGVAFDRAGNLFGTTSGGGLFNAGTVFKLSRDGQEQVLYSFTGGADGGYPGSGVVLDAAGNVYGTTSFGGASGQGVVYQIQEGVEKVLLGFDGVNGSEPNSITRDAQGNIYGTTFSGGTYGYGVVFRISAGGATTTLHNFSGGSDGATPQAAPLLSQRGLFGTTSGGGKYGGGVVFEIQ